MLLNNLIGAIKADHDCVCGHPKAAHEHYRRGTDCSLCPRGACVRYRADRRGRRPT